MPYDPMSGLSSLASQRLGVAERKRDRLAQASQEKQNQFNPLNIDNVRHIDGDTFEFMDTGQTFRVAGDPSRGVDTYERDPKIYEDRPDIFRNHRRNYAKLTGRPEWTITKNELAEQGQLQSAKTRQRLNDLGSQGLLDYRVTGQDAHGRGVIELKDRRTGGNLFADYSGQDENANYDSNFNAGQQLDDFFSGETGRRNAFTGSRSVKEALKDQPVNFAAGAARMVNDLGQAASVLTGTNSTGVDEFFENNRGRIDRFKSRFLSPEQQGRERQDQRNRERSSNLFEYRKQKNLAEGYSDREAAFRAGLSEYRDSFRDILTNPGKILDATVESLPYMVGVGAVGRVVANKAAQTITKREALKVITAGGTEQGGIKAAQKYLASKAGKKEIRRINAATGAGTIGITEGMSNGADVYARISNMSEAEAAESEHYQSLREQGLSHKEATKTMAEDAAVNTIVTSTALAAAASTLTGAAGFEGRLFTGRATLPKDLAKAAKKPATTLKGKAAQKVGQAARQVSKPGLQEAAEETIQSGGGELLGQIAEKAATGKGEVGPGVGAAAAEGTVIGFASGAGISAVTDTVRAAGNAEVVKKNVQGFQEKAKDTLVKRGEKKSTVALEKVRKKEDYDPLSALQIKIAEITEKGQKDPNSVTYDDMEEMTSYYKEAQNKGEIPTQVQDAYDVYNSAYEGQLAANVTKIAEKSPDEYTADDRAVIHSAIGRNAVPEAVKEKLPDNVQEVLAHSENINDSLEEAKEIEDIALEQATTKGSAENVKRTYENKFADAIGENGKPGLAWYVREMGEIMSDPAQDKDITGYLEKDTQLTDFINSQDRKIANYKQAAQQQKDVGSVKYQPQKNGKGGTQGMYETLLREKKIMMDVRKNLNAQYALWTGTSNAQLAQEIQLEPATADDAPGINLEAADTNQETAEAPEISIAATDTKKPKKTAKAKPQKPYKSKEVTRIRGEIRKLASTDHEGRLKLAQQALKVAQKQKDSRLPDLAKYVRGLSEKVKAKEAKAPTDNTPPKGESRTTEAVGANVQTDVEGNIIADENTVYSQDDINRAFGTLPEGAVTDVEGNVIADQDTQFSQEDIDAAFGNTATKTRPELLAEAKRLKIPNRHKMNKAKLAEEIDKRKLAAVNLEEANADDDTPGINLNADETTPENVEIPEAAAEAQPEQQAEELTQKEVERLQDAQDLQRYLGVAGVVRKDLVLTNPRDNALLQQLLESDMPADAAISAVINEIAPNPDTRNTQLETGIDPEVVEAFNKAAIELNKPGGGITPAIPLPVGEQWQDLKSEDPANVERLKGPWFGQSNMPDSAVLARMDKKFRDAKIPGNIGEAFQRKAPKASTLLSAHPDAMQIIADPGARRRLIRELKLPPREAKALNIFGYFYRTYEKSLYDLHRQLTSDLIKNARTGKFIPEWLGEYPLWYFQDQNGQIDPNVVGAMALETMNWIATSGPQTLFNDQQSINSILGREEDHPIAPEEWHVLARRGTLRQNASDQIGNAIFKHLNLKVRDNPSINPLFKDVVVSSLGGMALSVMAHENAEVGIKRRLSMSYVSESWMDAARQGRLEFLTDNQKADIQKQYKQDRPNNFVRNATTGVDNEDVNGDLRRGLEGGYSVFSRLFGAEPRVRTPRFGKPTMKDVPKRISRSVANIPQEMRDRMLYMSEREWGANTAAINTLERFNMEDLLESAYDYVPGTDEEIATRVHSTLLEGTLGRNLSLKRDMEAALDWNNQYKDAPFHFDYKMIRSGRVYINSNVINPQASKIHRFLFGMKEWAADVSTSRSGAAYENFQIALAQGFGIAIDKTNRASIIAQIEEVLASDEVENALEVLNQDGNITGADFDTMAVLLGKNGFTLGNGSQYGGEGVHTLAVLTAWNQFRQAEEAGRPTVKVNLPIETDGVTNGYIAGLMQTPPAVITEEYKNSLRAGGVMFKGDPWADFPAFVEAGGKDNYQQIAEGTKNILLRMADGTFNEKATSDPFLRKIQMIQRRAAEVYGSGLLPNTEELDRSKGRNWAKNPLMVVSYGASINSVIRAVINDSIDTFHEKLAGATELNTDAEKEAHIRSALESVYNIANVVITANREANTSGRKTLFDMDRVMKGLVNKFGSLDNLAVNFQLEGDLKKLVMQGIRNTYGTAIGNTLTEKMKPVEKIRRQLNHANKLMNIIFVRDFTRRLETLQELTNKPVGPDQRQQIFRDMYKEGLVPSVRTHLAKRGVFDENMEVTKYFQDNVKGPNTQAKALFNRDVGIIEKAFKSIYANEVVPKNRGSLFFQIISRMPTDDVGVSGVVKLIHALDGTNNSEAWGKNPVLNVHDAQVGGINMADTVAEETNRDFHDMHRDYSLPDEILYSMSHMMTIMAKNDPRFTTEHTGQVYNTFLDHLIERKEVDPKKAKGAAVETTRFIQNLRGEVAASRQGKQRLFDQISHINQFAKEGATAVIDQDTQEPIRTYALLNDPDIKSVNDYVTAFRDAVSKTSVADRERNIRIMQDALNQGADMDRLFRIYIEGANPSGLELMEMIQAIYKNTEAGETLAQLTNVMGPFLRGVQQITYGVTPVVGDEKASAYYNPGSRNIVFNKDGVKNTASTAVHELIHGATAHKLQQLKNSNPDEFKALFDRARNWARERLAPNYTPNNATERRVAMAVWHWKGKSRINMISEYLAYTLSTARSGAAYNLFFGSEADTQVGNQEAINTYMRDLLKSLENARTGLNTLRSTGQSVKRELFTEKYQVLEADKIGQIFDDLAQHEQGPIDIEHQTYLRNLIQEIVMPGMKALEIPMQQEIAINPYGTQNIGEIEGATIRLEAAGNKLTSSTDMSLQETAAHEYVHGVLKFATDNDHFVNKEARRLFELAREGTNPSDLIPAGETDPNAAIQAQQRYDYIFNSNKYHEFIAIGLTNKEFATALSKLDNREATKPIWGGGILASMTELLRRAIQFLSGQSMRTSKGSIHTGLVELAQGTIAKNQRNIQKVWDREAGKDEEDILSRAHSKFVEANDKSAEFLGEKIVEPLKNALESRERKRLDPKNPTVGQFVKSATYVALKAKDENVRKEFNRFYRSMGGRKDNLFFRLMDEVTPWKDENLGKNGGVNWIKMLRKSKVFVDKARQEIVQHTRSFLNKSFDTANYLSDNHKEAITRVLMKTDIPSLMDGESGVDINQIQNILSDQNVRDAELARLRGELQIELEGQGNSRLMGMYESHSSSLANFMVNGEHTLEHGLMNAHNITQQWNLDRRHRVQVKNQEKVQNLVDRITTMKALDLTNPADIQLTMDMVNHEMDRGPDNGFERLVGMQIDFREMSKEMLFEGQPGQMIKGYVYEIFDGDVNIEYVKDTPEEHARMEAEGMHRVGRLPQDNLDPHNESRVLYKGLKGLASYNKSIVSLTDMQHRGANLFDTVNYDSQSALRNLKAVRDRGYKRARENHFQPGYTSGSPSNMVPIFNNDGDIVDYRYMMTERNKQEILKKKDPFDKVLPRMFGSITDKNNSKDVNETVANLLYQEYEALEGNGETRFVEIGKHSIKRDGNGRIIRDENGLPIPDREARDMYNLLPKDMQRELRKLFGSEKMYLRDDVVNLVLGFRKMSIANNKLFGKKSDVVRMSERYWQEVVQLARIKIAALTPLVVVGNVASNIAILLAEGIKPSYIRQKSAEAISAMRQYQSDLRKRDELEREIGSRRALNKDTRSLESQVARLNVGLQSNPVATLVDEGLFTSIAEDLGAADDSLRDNIIVKATDKARTFLPGKVVDAGKELYMLPGTKSYRTAVAVTQYGDFVARYVKFKHDTEVKGKNFEDAINESLAAFIYYDIPQSRELQYLNDSGAVMFTKFFLRIQPIVARLYSQNPAAAFTVLAMQKSLLPQPFNENIMNYGLGNGFTQKPTAPWNIPGKMANTLDPSEPALLQWILNPFGL